MKFTSLTLIVMRSSDIMEVIIAPVIRKITAVDEILWCVSILSITIVNSTNSFKRDLGRGSKAAGWIASRCVP